MNDATNPLGEVEAVDAIANLLDGHADEPEEQEEIDDEPQEEAEAESDEQSDDDAETEQDAAAETQE